MSIPKHNSEGYADPTAYEALTNVTAHEKKPYLPLVYIASPFAGDTESNTLQARSYCRFALSQGCIPLAPHLHYPQFMDDSDPEQRECGLRFALILLGKCDALWAFGGNISEGMKLEIAKAKRRGLNVRYFNYNCEEVFPNE